MARTPKSQEVWTLASPLCKYFHFKLSHSFYCCLVSNTCNWLIKIWMRSKMPVKSKRLITTYCQTNKCGWHWSCGKNWSALQNIFFILVWNIWHPSGWGTRCLPTFKHKLLQLFERKENYCWLLKTHFFIWFLFIQVNVHCILVLLICDALCDCSDECALNACILCDVTLIQS